MKRSPRPRPPPAPPASPRTGSANPSLDWPAKAGQHAARTLGYNPNRPHGIFWCGRQHKSTFPNTPPQRPPVIRAGKEVNNATREALASGALRQGRDPLKRKRDRCLQLMLSPRDRPRPGISPSVPPSNRGRCIIANVTHPSLRRTFPRAGFFISRFAIHNN